MQRIRPAGLPLPYLTPLSATHQLYSAVTPVDARGRLADSSPARVLRWLPGQRISIDVVPDQAHNLIVVRAHGPNTVTKQGHIRLPAVIRHQCGIATGDRVLVLASPAPALTIYTMDALAQLLSRHPTEVRP